MEMVIFIGAQASGKSSFYLQRYCDSHMRINLDMLRTRNRESILTKACLAAKQSFVVDNTNPLRDDRKRYIELANRHAFEVRGYYFQSSVQDCIRRNEGRAVESRIPPCAIVSTIRKMELPNIEEGFDELHFVRVAKNRFIVEGWKP